METRGFPENEENEELKKSILYINRSLEDFCRISFYSKL